MCDDQVGKWLDSPLEIVHWLEEYSVKLLVSKPATSLKLLCLFLHSKNCI